MTSAPAPTVLVVGGVAGGASAATRARRMNERARIVLFEKDSHVSFANCGLPYHLGGEIPERDDLLVARPALFRDRFGIEVRDRTEVLSIDRAAKTVEVRDHRTGRLTREHYDKLILATGASPIVPPVPGVRARNVFTLRNLDDADRVLAALPAARRAAVVGGGFVGLEVAEQFRRRGLEVAVVEREPQVLPPLDREMAEPLHREIEAQGLRLELGRPLASVEERDGAAQAVVLADGTRIAADLVLLGLGARPNVGLAEAAGIALGPSGGIATDAHMRTSDRDVYAVGDAAEVAYGPTGGRMRVPLAGPANRAGRLAGEHAVTGAAPESPAAWGTAIVRVFGRAAGITGLSLAAAKRAGLDARAVHVSANHHAGYFPGAEPMLLKLVYEAGTGRLLGAQAVGGAGVDKRLDVVAAALHFGGTVHDLARLDLAYAPPFGSAKDPVHIAAFAAENDLAGVARLLPPDADLAPYQVVDVREAAEIAALPIPAAPHAIAIPLTDLRRRIGELDAARPTVVVCQTGVRAHVAVRILAQRGFGTVFNLSGASVVRDLAMNRRTPEQVGSARRAAPAPVTPCGATGPATAEIRAASVSPTCGGAAVGSRPMPDTCCSGAAPGDAPAPDAEMAPAQLAALLAAGAADLVDVRTGAEFRASRIRGSRHIPLDALTPEAVRTSRAAGATGPVVLVCKAGPRARMAASKLRAAGIPCVVVAGGTDACAAAGLPTEADPSAPHVWPIERQVRLVAGLMVLAGAAVGYFVHPLGYALTAFVGAGLTFAGLTDFCGMALLLGRCPWNR